MVGSSLVLGTMVLLVAVESAADWKVYLSGGVGISEATADTDGRATAAPQVSLSGQDSDSSPLVDGAIGIEIPMDELVPREWLLDVRLPDWPMRFEHEGAGLREYEFETNREGGDRFYTELKAVTSFWNMWLDTPLLAIYKPIQYLLGVGRQPQVRRWLEPGSIYIGGGVGFSSLEIDGNDNIYSGSDDFIDFAWNVGAGLNYELSERVSLSAGYRYVGLGDQKIDLVSRSVTPGPNDELEYDLDVHEFRAQVRVRVYDFLNPWR